MIDWVEKRGSVSTFINQSCCKNNFKYLIPVKFTDQADSTAVYIKTQASHTVLQKAFGLL